MTTGEVSGPARHFSASAAGYAATMAPSLRPMAAEVVRRARLRRNEDVLDIGTGTGTAAAMARGDGRRVVGLDAAEGMLAIARAEVDGVTFVNHDFADLPFADASFDAALSVHALLFAEDQVAALREWRRVMRSGGRLSLSVPGPDDLTPQALYGSIYAEHGLEVSGRYPSADAVSDMARAAGWSDVAVEADGTTAIRLPDEAAFRTWYGIGPRGGATSHFTPEQHRSLCDAMLAITPREPDGGFRIPFGTIYLTASA